MVLRENENLHGQIERSKDREELRSVRRDLEVEKRRAEELRAEVVELRKARDEAESKKAETKIESNKEVEAVRERCLRGQSEIDALKFKVKCLEDDL